MNSRNEFFVHFDVCADRLNSAWRTLKSIKENAGNPLVGPAFRFALVEYAVPYSRSDGTNKARRYLDTKYIPSELLAFHQELMLSRNQVLAHADLSVLEPNLSYVDLKDRRLVVIAQNIITGLEQLPRIDDIISLIEQTLVNMYAARDSLKHSLAP